MWRSRWLAVHVLFALAVGGATLPAQPATRAFVVTGAQIADGLGTPLRSGEVRVDGDTVTEVGARVSRDGATTVDAAGLVLAPGFIDVHNHSDNGLDENPWAASQVAQGITTVVLGQDGNSPWPVADYLSRRRTTPAAVNVALLVGHATVRQRVMGDDYKRAARADETSRMAALVDQGMREGAVGLSSGLVYPVGSHATTAELIAVTRAAARRGGLYLSHIRDQADHVLDAVAEAIAIGSSTGAPVQITHIALFSARMWGRASDVVALVDAARRRGVDVTADALPHLEWHSRLRSLLPAEPRPDAASIGATLARIGGAGTLRIVRLPTRPQYEGRRLDEVARMLGDSETDAFARLAEDEGAAVIGRVMPDGNLRVFYQQPWTMVASDGGVGNFSPRSAGAFPRVLGRLVREQGWMTLPAAIRKMTSLPAARLGLRDRGAIGVGMRADLVLFDPATVIDRADFENTQMLPVGIRTVWVNGVAVWNAASSTGQRPGRVLP